MTHLEVSTAGKDESGLRLADFRLAIFSGSHGFNVPLKKFDELSWSLRGSE